LLDGSDNLVELAFGEGAIRLSRPNQTFWFRLLDGEFPDYDAVVPNESKHSALFRRIDLGATLKRVSILVQDRARAVRFSFEENQLDIQLNNVDRGEIAESIPMELEGDNVTVGFNIRYLQDILGVVNNDTVTLNFAHPLAPCLIKSPENEDSLFVVMPMRLD
jgi:DNA polymerase-3 subunit beta